MGYIGLLLNDPYKIDRMRGDCLIYFFSFFVVLSLDWFLWLNEPESKYVGKALKGE
jgi:hypothetical protein